MENVKEMAIASVPVIIGVAVGMLLYAEINKQIAAKAA